VSGEQNVRMTNTSSDYARIARAIEWITSRVAEQPTLEEIAAHVHLSPFHFQRLFTRWSGTTPKRFLQVLTLETGKPLLAGQMPLLEVADRLGLSSASRLHEHFVTLEAASPGEYRSGGENLVIRHAVRSSPFGPMFIAQTPRGICRAAFADEQERTSLARWRTAQLALLSRDWPGARLHADSSAGADLSGLLDAASTTAPQPLSLHVRGTNFQIAVWRALLRIPPASLCSYAGVAKAAGKSAAIRAAGTAIGANPVAFLIPCHRVIRQSGALGGYRWGTTRKLAIQCWERLRATP
jgi:AraC family transcriptional regulator, regulatory protein of adaptative response / methylated-DNA-[protein]-cysteine methyltransferase